MAAAGMGRKTRTTWKTHDQRRTVHPRIWNHAAWSHDSRLLWPRIPQPGLWIYLPPAAKILVMNYSKSKSDAHLIYALFSCFSCGANTQTTKVNIFRFKSQHASKRKEQTNKTTNKIISGQANERKSEHKDVWNCDRRLEYERYHGQVNRERRYKLNKHQLYRRWWRSTFNSTAPTQRAQEAEHPTIPQRCPPIQQVQEGGHQLFGGGTPTNSTGPPSNSTGTTNTTTTCSSTNTFNNSIQAGKQG